MVKGWDLYWKLHGREVAGREIYTIHEDTAGDPALALSKARRLVEDEEVALVVGPLFAHVGLAIGEYLSSVGTPNFRPIGGADDITQRSRLDGVLNVPGPSNSLTPHVLGAWAADQGYERAVTICSDFAFGHESCGGFANTFTDAGGEIVGQFWNPLNTQDFATFMAQIRAADPDVVFATQSGGDSHRFSAAYHDFGLKADIPLLTSESITDQAHLRGMDREAALGTISIGRFAEGLETDANEAFVVAYWEEYALLPSYFAADSYMAAEWVAEALRLVDGNIEDTEAYLEAVRSLEFESASGPLNLDEYGSAIRNVYVREVVESPYEDPGTGQPLLWNAVLETFEGVSQFWTYDPERYLECPLYSREYQGLGSEYEGC